MNECLLPIKNWDIVFKDNIDLINQCTDLINLCHIQRFTEISETIPQFYDNIVSALQLIIDKQSFFNETYPIVNNDFISAMLSTIKQCCTTNDYILLADICQVQLLPLFIEIQSILIQHISLYSSTEYLNFNLSNLKLYNITLFEIVSDHKWNNKIYHLEYSDTGLISLSIDTAKDFRHYITTLCNPYNDAKKLAEYYFEKNISHYIIYGFGMGYHLIEMAKKYTNASLDIFESDLSILKIAFQYADLTELLENKNIKIHYDPNFEKLSKILETLNSINEQERFLIHYPSIENIKIPSIKEWMEDLFAKDNIIRNEFPRLMRNFKSNILHYNSSVENLRNSFQNKILFIIAAGPSLDKNIKLLQNMQRENCIILAVGTVLKKLLTLEIKPDYFIVSDPYPSVYRQISGIENSSIPMLYLSTALKEFALNYKGEKYIICQNEFNLAEEFANKMGFALYNTGGSVSTTALDIGIQLGCRKIIFLGLDLAYTNGYAHASDTSRRKATILNTQKLVKSLYGDMIPASKAFIWYRKWIEDKIHQNPDIEFIDATEGGAYIEGSTVMTLKGVLQTEL